MSLVESFSSSIKSFQIAFRKQNTCAPSLIFSSFCVIPYRHLIREGYCFQANTSQTPLPFKTFFVTKVTNTESNPEDNLIVHSSHLTASGEGNLRSPSGSKGSSTGSATPAVTPQLSPSGSPSKKTKRTAKQTNGADSNPARKRRNQKQTFTYPDVHDSMPSSGKLINDLSRQQEIPFVEIRGPTPNKRLADTSGVTNRPSHSERLIGGSEGDQTANIDANSGNKSKAKTPKGKFCLWKRQHSLLKVLSADSECGNTSSTITDVPQCEEQIIERRSVQEDEKVSANNVRMRYLCLFCLGSKKQASINHVRIKPKQELPANITGKVGNKAVKENGHHTNIDKWNDKAERDSGRVVLSKDSKEPKEPKEPPLTATKNYDEKASLPQARRRTGCFSFLCNK